MPTTTILLDMDDTLLDCDMSTFIPDYLAKLSQAMADFGSSDEIRAAILAATRNIRANQDPHITNHDAFYACFLAKLNLSYTAIQPTIDHFYKRIYPTLKRHINQRTTARPLVKHLFSEGYRVVIATNPLFPKTAIEQRLAWGGVADFPYALITYLENMHFSKPLPAYYEEILALTSASPSETLMIGDNPVNDIAPARASGLKTWWVTDLADPTLSVETDHQGTLAELLKWVQAGWLRQ